MFFTCKEQYIRLEIFILKEKNSNKRTKAIIKKMFQILFA